MGIKTISGIKSVKDGFKAFFKDYFRCKIAECHEELELIGVYFDVTSEPEGSWVSAVVKREGSYLFVDSDLSILSGPYDTATPLYVICTEQLNISAKLQNKEWLSVVRSARSGLTKLETSPFGTTKPVYVGEYSYADACLVKKNRLCGIVGLNGKSLVPASYSSIYPFCFTVGTSETSFFKTSEGEASLYICYTGVGDQADVYDTKGNLIFEKADFFTADKTVTTHVSCKTSILGTNSTVEAVRVKLGGKEHVISVNDLYQGNAPSDVVLHKVTRPVKTMGRHLDDKAKEGEVSVETAAMLKRFSKTVANARGIPDKKILCCIHCYDLLLKAQDMKGRVTRESKLEALDWSEELCKKLRENELDTAGDVMQLSDNDLRKLRRNKLSDSELDTVRELIALMNIIYT